MNQPRLPRHYRALVTANLAVGIAGILLRPFYPKSIFVAMFIMATILAVFCGWTLLQEKLKPSTSSVEKRLVIVVFGVGIGAGVWGMYITLRSILE